MYIDNYLTQGLGFGLLYVSTPNLLYESKFPIMLFLVTIRCSLLACLQSTWSSYGTLVYGSNDRVMMRRHSRSESFSEFYECDCVHFVRMSFVAQMVFRCVTLRHQLSMPQ